jgi:hypothetical protein
MIFETVVWLQYNSNRFNGPEFSSENKINSMKKVICSFILFFLSLQLRCQSNTVVISPLIMGQGYHYTDWHDPMNLPIKIFEATDYYTNNPAAASWADVRNTKTRLVRVGGNQYNIGPERPLSGQEAYYVAIIDDIRKNGCEPVITLPFLLSLLNSTTSAPNAGTSTYTYQLLESVNTATTILNLVNKVNQRTVKYVIVGNEPDKDYLWQATGQGGTMTPEQVATNIAGYVKPLADVVKSFDPSIKVIAPEYTHCLPQVYDYLFNPANANSTVCPGCYIGGISTTTSMGTAFPTQQPYVDFISTHFYGPDFNSTSVLTNTNLYFPQPVNAVWTPSITFCNIERYFKCKGEPSWTARRYRGALRYLRQLCNDINATRVNNQPKIGFMVTELNSSHFNSAPTNTSNPDNNDPSGNDTRSMQGAQNLARMYALAMEYGAASVMMWSVREGSLIGSYDDRGYLATNSGNKRGTWFHYKMLGDWFRGTYYRDEVLAHFSTQNGANISSDVTSEPLNVDWLHFNNSSSNTQTVNVHGSTLTINTSTTYEQSLVNILETKAFAAKGEKLAVMILNHSSSTQTAVFRFDGQYTFSTVGDFKYFSFSVNTSTTEYVLSAATGSNAAIEPNSTTVLIFDCAGSTLLTRYVYTQSVQAQTYGTDFSITAGSAVPATSVAVSSSATCLSNPNTGSIAVIGAPIGSIFEWSKPPSQILFTTGTINTAYSTPAHYLTPGTYVIKITPSATTGCISYSTSATLQKLAPIVDAGNDHDFCVAGAIATLGNINLPNNQTYAWYPTGGSVTSFTLGTSQVTTTTFYTLVASVGSCTFADMALMTASLTNAVDLMLPDSYLPFPDIGMEPNMQTTGGFWKSPSIYFGLPVLLAPLPLQVPPYPVPVANSINTVNVIVKNRSCNAFTSPQASVTLYTAKSAGSQWWYHYYNFNTNSNITCLSLAPSCTPVPTGDCGARIGSLFIPTIAARGTAILSFTWNAPPNNICLSGSPGTPGSWSFVAYLSHSLDPVSGAANSTNIHLNSYVANNITSKDIDVLMTGGQPVGIRPFMNDSSGTDTKLTINQQRDFNDETLLDYSNLTILLPKSLIQKWRQAGEQGEGVLLLNDSSLQIISDEAYLDHVQMDLYEKSFLGWIIDPIRTPDVSGGHFFEFDFNHLNYSNIGLPMGAINNLVEKDSLICPSCEEDLGSQLIQTSNSTVTINGNTIVQSGDTLEYLSSRLLFGKDAKITVQPGGILKLDHCILESSCYKNTWQGIEALGNGTLTANSITVTNCRFKNTDTPIKAANIANAVLENNSLVGSSEAEGMGISMLNCKDFHIQGNRIARFNIGMKTTHTYSTSLSSSIENNFTEAVQVGLHMNKDNHLQTDIRCNRFGYIEYGMFSDSCSLKNFGSASEGAGNRFVSHSTSLNNKFLRNVGNIPSYYYNPGNVITSGMNVNLFAATTNRECYLENSPTEDQKMALLKNKITETEFKLIPNPNNGHLTVLYKIPNENTGRIEIIDIQGRVLRSISVTDNEGKLAIDMNGLANGVYIINFTGTSGFQLHAKSIIQY